MNSKSKITTIVAVILALIGVALYFSATKGGDTPTGNYVTYGIFLVIVTAGLAILFSLINIFTKPALLKKALIALGLMAVVLVVSYIMAKGNVVYDASGNPFEGSEGNVSKWVGTFINYSIILIVVGAVLFLIDMIRNIVK